MQIESFSIKKNQRVKIFFTILLISSFVFISKVFAVPPADVPSPYLYNFNQSGILQETSIFNESTSPYWWINGGGQFEIYNGLGRTMPGDLGEYDK